MFGFGKQKKDTFQEPQQEEYYYDEYDANEYEEDYGYDNYAEGEYDRPADYDRGDRRTRTRNDSYSDASYEETPVPKAEPAEQPLQQEVERLEETVAQLKHQLEVKQTELTTMATTLTEKDQQLQDTQAGNDKKLQALQAEKDKQIQLLMEQLDQSTKQLNQTEQTQSEALAAAQEEITELKRAKAASEAMKDELANILVESKKQEKQILERAEYEANGIRNQAQQDADQMLHDSALELRVMKQEIKNYRKRLRVVQEETAQFFVKLLANSDTLLDEE